MVTRERDGASPMIMVRLFGGLANQMFQYAAAKRLASIHGTTVRMDTSWFDNIPPNATRRSYELHHFRITGTVAERWETIGNGGLRQTPRVELPVALFRRVRPRYRLVRERHVQFDQEVLHLPDGVCLLGHWQSERYFMDAADLIREEFQFRHAPSPENEQCLRRMQEANSVAIHVRRGDYADRPATNAYHGVGGIDYYERAIAYLRERVRDPLFFVFSDDLDWARDHLAVGENAVFVSHNRGDVSYEDLRLMSCAAHNIIANSSFSWWGAWLNSHHSKIVVAPERWVSDPQVDTSDVLPRAWIRL